MKEQPWNRALQIYPKPLVFCLFFLHRSGFWADPSMMMNQQLYTTMLSQRTPTASVTLTSWLAGPSAAPWLSGQISSLYFMRTSAASCYFRLLIQILFGLVSQNCRTCELWAAQIRFHDWPSTWGEKDHKIFLCNWVLLHMSVALYLFVCLLNICYFAMEVLAFLFVINMNNL